MLAASGCGFVVMLHSFPSLLNLPICYKPALDIGGLSCVIVFVSCPGVCIGQMLAAISWYSWMIVTTCDAVKSIWSVVVILSVSRLVSVCKVCFVLIVVVGLPSW